MTPIAEEYLRRIAEALEKLVTYPRPDSASPAPTPPAVPYRWATHQEWHDSINTGGYGLSHEAVFAAARELAPAPVQERKFNCPPFCGKCQKCHDIGPCPAPVPTPPAGPYMREPVIRCAGPESCHDRLPDGTCGTDEHCKHRVANWNRSDHAAIEAAKGE